MFIFFPFSTLGCHLRSWLQNWRSLLSLDTLIWKQSREGTLSFLVNYLNWLYLLIQLYNFYIGVELFRDIVTLGLIRLKIWTLTISLLSMLSFTTTFSRWKYKDFPVNFFIFVAYFVKDRVIGIMSAVNLIIVPWVMRYLKEALYSEFRLFIHWCFHNTFDL